MTTIEKSVDVRVPVRTAYNQWTQFESFPYFMEGVDRVIQLDDRRLHWETTIAGAHREFDTEITEQHPDERVAWHTVEGPSHGGVVTFHRLDEHSTRVSLQMEYEPDTLTEKAGAALGIVGGRISGDLQRFKQYIEEQGHETGAWRGEIDAPPQTPVPHPPPPDHDPGQHDPAVMDDQPIFPGMPGPVNPWIRP
ncbi:SRPBCC family protein [Kutzneria buriramensis]|uniref:Polyketide cyclase/dehydrase/lipid transport protein n=1 Tax=Kutzneria buriramensis TaxID=1045776 RepID=A0A3E0I6T1_9PSEU|nr:polyketide cyclase/dehydrase/lipid transport protein [Kutzneria buriramensis]